MNESAEYEIRLRDLFSAQLKSLESKMNAFENKIKSVNSSTDSLGRNIAGVFGGITLARAAERAIEFVTELGSNIVSLGTNMEKTRISFETLLQGGALFSNNMISQFQKFAQETPFSTQDVLSGARQLTAYRFAAEDIIPTMKKLGDITSGLNLDFKDVVWLVGHTKSIGHLDSRILREFTLRGIGIDKYIEKVKKISGEEFHRQIKGQLITWKDVSDALTAMTAKGGQFYDLNEKLSRSVAGRWERFKDTLEIIGTRMGEQLLPMLASALDKAFEVLNEFKNVDMSSIIANFTSLATLAGTIANLFSGNKATGEKGFWDNLTDNISSDWRNIAHIIDLSVLEIEASLMHLGSQLSLFYKGDYSSSASWNQNLLNTIAEHKKAFTDAQAELKNAKITVFGGGTLQERLDRANFAAGGITRKGVGGGGDEGGDVRGHDIGIEKVGSATKNITLNIQQLVGNITYEKWDSTNTSDITETIKRVLLTAVNDVNLISN